MDIELYQAPGEPFSALQRLGARYIGDPERKETDQSEEDDPVPHKPTLRASSILFIPQRLHLGPIGSEP